MASDSHFPLHLAGRPYQGLVFLNASNITVGSLVAVDEDLARVPIASCAANPLMDGGMLSKI
jgi:hypothetical protein